MIGQVIMRLSLSVIIMLPQIWSQTPKAKVKEGFYILDYSNKDLLIWFRQDSFFILFIMNKVQNFELSMFLTLDRMAI